MRLSALLLLCSVLLVCYGERLGKRQREPHSRELHELPPVVPKTQKRNSVSGRVFRATERKEKNGNSAVPVTLVVSHCLHPLGWLQGVIDNVQSSNYTVQNIFVYSKCGKRVDKVPSSAKIIRLPNVGRCDHSYLHFISETKIDKGVVLFLKDTRHSYWLYQPKDKQSGLASLRSYRSMVQQAHLSSRQFSCRQFIDSRTGIANAVITKVMLTWKRKYYKHNYTDIGGKKVPFAIHSNMRAWVEEMGIIFPKPLMTICFGGVFAVSATRFRQVNSKVWSKLAISLSRGENIQESHFMERTWSGLLAKDIFPSFQRRVRCFKKDICGYIGNIVIKWKALSTVYLCNARLKRYADLKHIEYCTVKQPKEIKNSVNQSVFQK